MKLRAALCLCLLVGCDAAEETEPAKSDSKAEGDEAKADEETPKAEAESSAKAEPANAAGDAPSKSDAQTDCPKSLSGRESVDRVITKACGVVPVTGTYKVDGATLTLEAGASLSFADGAELSVGYYEPAKLIVNGTAAEPVTFTTSGDKAPGVWKGVRLHSKAARSSVTGLVLEYAGDRNGALKIDAEDVIVRETRVQHIKEAGIVAGKEASFKEFSDNKFVDVGRVAMRLPANVVSGLGIGNEYSDSARVVVTAGSIESDAHWAAQDTAFVINGEVKVNGKDGARATLELDPGTRLEFDGDARFSVGYYAEASFRAKGTADKPIVFTSTDRQEPGAWRGVAIHGKGEGELAHATLENGGKREREGVLLAEGKARLSVDHVTFQNNAVGVVLRGKEVSLGGLSNSSFAKTPLAITLHPVVLGSVGSGNTYADDPRIEIDRGTVDADATWTLQPGAQVLLEGELQVSDARLELPAGYELRIKDGGGIGVGYYDTATVAMMGTKEAPVRLVGQRDAAGAWKSIVLHNKAKANVLNNVVLRNAGGKGGVEVRESAEVKIDGLSCEECSAETLNKHDKAVVEATNVQ